MSHFDTADAVRKLVTTPDDLGPCQQYCEALKAEVRRHAEQEQDIWSLLADAGVGRHPLPEGVRLLVNERDRLRAAIQTALDSPCLMGADDIEVLAAVLERREL
jgi:hypothetical protein